MDDDDDTTPAPATGSLDPHPGALTIDIVDRHRMLPAGAAEWLAAAAGRVLAPLDCVGEVRVAVVGDAEMARTHEEFCEIAGTTDVLTFDCSEAGEDGRPVLDADVVTCLDEAVRQGTVRGHPPERELLLYIVHGVLHCLGFDDHDDESAAAMHRREDELLEAAGVGATYAPAGLAARRPG